jgi:UDP-N-acetylglucosamine transferase subunit ALG13
VIFVTIGTSEPFERLLRAFDDLAGDEELVIQAGRSRTRPARARCVDFLDYDELVDHVLRARVVVSHAGVGTVLSVTAAGRRPVVVPRLQLHGEAVDDHQLAFARRIALLGLATVVEDVARLPALLAGSVATEIGADAREVPLVAELRTFLHATAVSSR